KGYTWPVYLATLRARHECRVMLLVLCPDAKTAAACAEPIDTDHPDWVLKPLVLGPDGVPVVVDPSEAQRLPRLAVLSALLRIKGPLTDAALFSLCVALEELKAAAPKEGALYYDYLVRQLSVTNRRRLEKIMITGTYEFQSDFAREYVANARTD